MTISMSHKDVEKLVGSFSADPWDRIMSLQSRGFSPWFSNGKTLTELCNFDGGGVRMFWSNPKNVRLREDVQ